MNSDLQQALASMPLVAILRGITPRECVDVGRMLVEEGFSIIEVPLNFPQPLVSIERLAQAIGEQALVGAGTVLHTGQVSEVASAGGFDDKRFVLTAAAAIQHVTFGNHTRHDIVLNRVTRPERVPAARIEPQDGSFLIQHHFDRPVL